MTDVIWTPVDWGRPIITRAGWPARLLGKLDRPAFPYVVAIANPAFGGHEQLVMYAEDGRTPTTVTDVNTSLTENDVKEPEIGCRDGALSIRNKMAIGRTDKPSVLYVTSVAFREARDAVNTLFDAGYTQIMILGGLPQGDYGMTVSGSSTSPTVTERRHHDGRLRGFERPEVAQLQLEPLDGSASPYLKFAVPLKDRLHDAIWDGLRHIHPDAGALMHGMRATIITIIVFDGWANVRITWDKRGRPYSPTSLELRY